MDSRVAWAIGLVIVALVLFVVTRDDDEPTLTVRTTFSCDGGAGCGEELRNLLVQQCEPSNVVAVEVNYTPRLNEPTQVQTVLCSRVHTQFDG